MTFSPSDLFDEVKNLAAVIAVCTNCLALAATLCAFGLFSWAALTGHGYSSSTRKLDHMQAGNDVAYSFPSAHEGEEDGDGVQKVEAERKTDREALRLGGFILAIPCWVLVPVLLTVNSMITPHHDTDLFGGEPFQPSFLLYLRTWAEFSVLALGLSLLIKAMSVCYSLLRTRCGLGGLPTDGDSDEVKA